MDAKDFLNANIAKLQAVYDPSSLMEKITKVAKKAGVKVVFVVMILYYATLDKDIPVKDRMMIIAALGYFIFPIDAIPDALPFGFTDDMAAAVYVLKQIWGNLTPSTISKAKSQTRDIFGDVEEEDFNIPGLGQL